MSSALRLMDDDSRKLRGEDCVRALRALGFRLEGMTPIRVVLRRDRVWAYVPRHGRISDAEVAQILATASVDAEDFERALLGIEAMQPLSSSELPRIAIAIAARH